MRRFLFLSLALVAACHKPNGGGTGGTSSGGSSSSGSTSTGGSSAGGSSTGTSSGTTSGGGPYQGFDAGPHPEPPVDVGCAPLEPHRLDAGTCVMCRWDADCPPGRVCGVDDVVVPFLCVPCRPDGDGGTVGCPAGQHCESPTLNPTCAPNCDTAGIDCHPGYCDVDSGWCFKNACRDDADCRGFAAQGDAGGVCDNAGTPAGHCVGCFPDGGGCPEGQLCNRFSLCEPNCLDGGSSCPKGSHCSSTGLCALGCRVDSDCGGADPFCELTLVPPACAPCGGTIACPSWQPRCAVCSLGAPYCTNTCGQCADDSDCAPGQHCGTQGCGCSSNADCAAYTPNAPICLGLGDGGPGQTTCACRTSTDCAANFVCETRPPYRITAVDKLGNYSYGGLCMPSCVGADAGYCAAALGAYSTVCNTATGYCVPCVQNSDCATNSSQPIAAPDCIPFEKGEFPSIDTNPPPLKTGGGQCGCTGTASCTDGLACFQPSSPGTCQTPCTYVEGLDSCQSFFTMFTFPYCNTFTGACVQCLDDYDCGGAICDRTGTCVQCEQANQCPGDLPGCYKGRCGACGGEADCPPDFTCSPLGYSGGPLRCLAPCVLGDDAGMGSISDAGPACPSPFSFCIISGSAPAGTGWCSECRYGYDDCAYSCCGTYCSPTLGGCNN